MDRLRAWQTGSQVEQPHGPNAFKNSVFYQWYWIDQNPPVVGADSPDGKNQDVPSLDNAWLAGSLFFLREFARENNRPALETKADEILSAMDFRLWLNESTHLFWSGGRQSVQSGFEYNYFSNENRIINYVAFLLGHISETELRTGLTSLAQPAGVYQTIRVDKVNWDGSYFTYAAPALFIREMNLAYGPDTIFSATLAQIRYALHEKEFTIWGHSDCYGVGATGYQLRGAPPRGSNDDEQDVGDSLVSPHVSGLALNTPYACEALDNLIRMKTLFPSSYDAEYGFADSVDAGTGQVSYRFSSLNQEWMFLSIANYLSETIWKYMYQNSRVQLLHSIILDLWPCGVNVPSDFDFDTDVDQSDFGAFQVCLTGHGQGPPSQECLCADLDSDGDVDLDDFGLLQACFSGADIPADPSCAEQ
jgi:hypothetical protein